MLSCIGFIFARGGSKGLPGKNVRLFDGRPLISWAIQDARNVPRIRRVIVSTDDKKIAEVARQSGAEVPFLRPPELAADDSPEWLAWRHALEFVQKEEGSFPDAMVSVPATAPLRKPRDIEKCLDLFESGGTDMVITVTEAHRNPCFNMVKVNEDGTVALVDNAGPRIARRQDAPKVFDMTTVAFVADPKYVIQSPHPFSGRVRAVEIPRERAVDIDTELDFQIAEFIASKSYAA
ncbi:MAG: acylneuraminate cytidylyltransferase family protein [Verrucomicrobia bacterium]|nr:acylneuraminate cytidylyltransferase family protein [Verrucomicrobiota bacterium]